MALKFRGLSQIRDASIELSKIKDISSGVILGRPEEQSANYDDNAASPSELSGEDVRRIAELHSDDNVHFANIESDAITATSADLGAGALIAGTATLSGDMNAQGAVTGASSDMVGLAKSGSLESGAATLASANIAGTLEAGASTLASATVNGTLEAGASTLASATVTNAASIGSTLDVTGKITGSDEAEFSGALSAGNSTFSSITVGGNITATGTLHADGALTAASADFGAGSLDAGAATLASATVNGVVLADSFSSSSVNIDGGSIDNTSIGSTTPESGAFTDVSATGNLTVDGNLTVSGDMVYVNTTNLQVKDPIMHVGEGNAADIQDLGFFASYKSETGVENVVSNSDFDSDTSDWDISNVSSGDSISWSSSYGGSVEFVSTNMTTFNNYARLTQEFTMPSNAPSGVYTIKVKIDGYDTNSYRQFMVSLTGTSQSTAQISNTVRELHSVYGGELELNWTYNSASSSAYAKKIWIQYGANQYGSAVPVTANLYVKEVKIYDQNGQEVTISNGLELKHAGMVRDADDAKFKLFSTSEDLSSKTVVDFSSVSKSILVANIEGDIEYDNAVTFSVSGDVAGSVSFSGNNSPDIAVTIQDNSVQLSNIDFFIDENDMASDSAIHVPSQASVKAYAASQISSGGLSGISAQDIQMVDSSGSFIAVHKEFQYTTVSADNESSRTINMDYSIESEFKDLSMVYLNGKKLRYSSDSGTSNDYWFTETVDASASIIGSALTASDQTASDQFGRVSISQDGNVMSVGAFAWDRSGGGSNHGGVYIYDWNSSTNSWDQRGDVFSPTSDATNNVRFGTSTSLSSDGTYLAVGALLYTDAATYQGGAFVYKWNSSTNSWDKQGSTVVAGDAGASDYHANVSINSDGTILSVGANLWDGSSGENHGAVYVYDWKDTDSDGTADTWVQRGSITKIDTLEASDGASGDGFGYGASLSKDGNVLVVGAAFWEGSANDQGGVYIYDKSGDSWSQRGDVLTASDAGNGDRYGTSVSSNSDGSIIAVGSIMWDGSSNNQGGVYVYEYIGGSWSQKGSTITHSDAGAEDYHVTCSLSSDGTVLAVGAMGWDASGKSDSGAVYIYDWNSSTEEWDQRTRITASDAANSDRFGYGVSLSSDGTILAVGARDWEGSYTDQGGVYIYDWDGSNWSQRGDVLVSNFEASGIVAFGTSIELNGDGTVLAVGQIGSWSSQSNKQIEIFDWNSSTNSWDYRIKIDAEDDSTRSYSQSSFGISVGMTSSADKVVAAGLWDNSGKGYVYTYEISGNSNIIIPSDSGAADQFGRNVSLSANGEILFVGAPYWEGDDTNQGGVYVYDWSSSSNSWTQRGDVLESNSPTSNGNFGFAVETNGDGTVLSVTEYYGSVNSNNVQIFDWNSSTSSWDYRTSISDIPAGSVNFGYSISLSSDSEKLAIAANGNGSTVAGRIHTYSLPSANSTVAKLNFKQDIISENDKVETILIVKT